MQGGISHADQQQDTMSDKQKEHLSAAAAADERATSQAINKQNNNNSLEKVNKGQLVSVTLSNTGTNNVRRRADQRAIACVCQ